MTIFLAFLNAEWNYINAKPKDIVQLLGQQGVVNIAEVDASRYESTMTFSAGPTSAAGDIYSGADIIPWWKQYTNTNDSLSSNNLIFQFDGAIFSQSTNLTFANIDNGYVRTGPKPTDIYDIPSNDWGLWHATHVAGVIGAKHLIRGINPAQPIRLLGGSTSPASMEDRFNVAIAYSELNNYWGVINLSVNNGGGLSPQENPYEFSNDAGRMMAIASNTNLVVQSAGNFGDGVWSPSRLTDPSYDNGDACNYSYSFNNSVANPYDGIVVMGGHDINGQVSAKDSIYKYNDFVDGFPEDEYGSNYGRCIDLWAPSRQITSLRYNTNLTQVLSGTSFAAPIAAAIASRYGNNQTRPVERESFLRFFAQNTGSVDQSGFPVQSVKWNSGNAGVLKRYPVSSAWSSQNTANTGALNNNKYNDIWNSLDYSGTVVLDLGQTRTVHGIRVTLRSSVIDGNSGVHPVSFWVAPTNGPTSTVATSPEQTMTTPKHYDRTPVSIPLGQPISTRYVILRGQNFGSWLAYSEIEVYGL